MSRCLYRYDRRAFLLVNVPCTNSECSGYGRMFDSNMRSLPDFVNTTLSAAFFDISEDVSCELLIVNEWMNDLLID